MVTLKTVGAKLTQIREARNLSRTQLAERSAMPVSLIQRIEDGEVIPALTPLVKLGRALGVRLGTFLDDVEHVGPIVNRRGPLTKAVRFAGFSEASAAGLDFHALAADKCGRHMEPFLVDLDPAAHRNHALSTHEGEEFMFVLAGRVEIQYGRDQFQLSEGDSIYLDSIVPHHVHAQGETPAKILAVVYAPF